MKFIRCKINLRRTTTMKKILSLILVSVFVLGAFAACGGKGNDIPADTMLIGAIGPTTGGAAIYGSAVKNGMQLAIDEINAAGGVNGIKLMMDFQDDEHNTEKAVNAYNNLKDKGAQLIIGTVTSQPCKAVAPLAAADNMFLLTPSGSAVECIAAKNAFRICFSDPDQGKASAIYIGDHKVASKVAVIYDSSDVYSKGIYDSFVEEAKNQPFEIVEAQAFTADSKTDFSVQLQKIKDSGAELVFLPIYYQEAALILQQAETIGLPETIKYFGCDGLDGLVAQLKDDAALADGVILLTPFAADASDDKTKTFTAAYKAKFDGEIPNQFAADGYDAVYTVVEAIKKANITDPKIASKELSDKLTAVMTQISVEGVTGTMTWNAEGEPTKAPRAMYIENGSYKAMD